MNLVKYRPLTGTLSDRDLDIMFGDLFDGDFWNFGKHYPKVDVREDKEGYIVEADLPGVNEKDVDVKVENDLLTIQSRKAEENEEKQDGYIVRERKSSCFARSFVLPKDVNREAIEASMKNGVLTLKLSKNPEAKPKTIEVKGA